MKKIYITIASAMLCAQFVGAQTTYKVLKVHLNNGDSTVIKLSKIDSLTVQTVTEPEYSTTPIEFYLPGYGGTTRAATGGSSVNKFVVYGKKLTDDKYETIMENFSVTKNTSSSTTSNVTGWAYEGNKPYGYNAVQTLQYWTYQPTQYVFTAFTAANNDISKLSYGNLPSSSDKVIITKNNDSSDELQNGYTVIAKPGAALDSLMFSNRKDDYSYMYSYSPVEFKMYNVAAKVRVGIYETIPGYNVKINKVYTSTGDAIESQFVLNVNNFDLSKDNTIKVTYNSNNVPEFALDESNISSSLTLGGNLISANALGSSQSDITFDIDGAGYTSVFPSPSIQNGMSIKLDYTLTATDGSGETINVKGATATVPSEMTSWEIGNAYTYIFKIEDKTTSATSEDISELFPISLETVLQEQFGNNSSMTR